MKKPTEKIKTIREIVEDIYNGGVNDGENTYSNPIKDGVDQIVDLVLEIIGSGDSYFLEWRLETDKAYRESRGSLVLLAYPQWLESKQREMLDNLSL